MRLLNYDKWRQIYESSGPARLEEQAQDGVSTTGTPKNTNKDTKIQDLIPIDPEAQPGEVKAQIKKIYGALTEAKKWWTGWLNSAPVHEKWLNNNPGETEESRKKIFDQYFDCLNNIELKFFDVNPRAAAWILKDVPKTIHISLIAFQRKNDVEMATTLIHETDHLFYYIRPLTPDQKAVDCFSYRKEEEILQYQELLRSIDRSDPNNWFKQLDGERRMRYEKFMSEFKDNVFRLTGIKFNAYIPVKKNIEALGTTVDNFPAGWIGTATKVEYSERYGKMLSTLEQYINMLTDEDLYRITVLPELPARVSGFRYSVGVKDGEEMVEEQFINVLRTVFGSPEDAIGLNFMNLDNNTLWFIVYWAIQGYPPIKQFIDNLNDMTLNTPTGDEIKKLELNKLRPNIDQYKPKEGIG